MSSPTLNQLCPVHMILRPITRKQVADNAHYIRKRWGNFYAQAMINHLIYIGNLPVNRERINHFSNRS